MESINNNPTAKFKFNTIKQKYGEEGHGIIRKIREMERLSKTEQRNNSHIRFNLQCKHTDIIPLHARVKSGTNNKQARLIVHRAEKGILNAHISEIVRKKGNLKTKKQKVNDFLKDKLEED